MRFSCAELTFVLCRNDKKNLRGSTIKPVSKQWFLRFCTFFCFKCINFERMKQVLFQIHFILKITTHKKTALLKICWSCCERKQLICWALSEGCGRCLFTENVNYPGIKSLKYCCAWYLFDILHGFIIKLVCYISN